MKFLLVACCILLAVPCEGQTPEDEEGTLLDKWETWSRDAIKTWQDAKVLHGNDLDKAKRLAASIAVSWKRCQRAEKLEELLHDAHRRTFDRLIESILADKKKWTKSELDELRKIIQAKLATISTAKSLFASIARDLDSLHLLMKAKLSDAKALPADKKKQFEEHVTELRDEHGVFTAADLWDQSVEERAQKALHKIDELLKLL